MAQSDGGVTMTPMMKQYYAIRKELPDDVLLFFRLGDFYELFMEDAKVAAGLISVALTKRNGMPMCGVPHHAAEGYIGKLVSAGKRVAIAEQTTEAKPGQIVERAVTQIISAGTIADLNLLDQKRPNFLAGVAFANRKFGLACIDHTTGDFRLTEFGERSELEDELGRLQPSELLYSEEQEGHFSGLANAFPYDGYAFLAEQASFVLREHFKVQSLDGFGCGGFQAAVGAAGAIFHYLKNQLRRGVEHLTRLQAYHGEHFVLVDAASQGNLDLVASRGGAKHTLLAALDRTCTPMGARRLRDWILHPLRDLAALTARQDLIEAFLAQPFLLGKTQDALKAIRDIERTLGRLSQGSGNARDLLALAHSLLRVPEVRDHLEALCESAGSPADLGRALLPDLHPFDDLVALLEGALADEPPGTIREGGMFRDGYSSHLDELRRASTEGKQWIADLQAREIARTGIKSLKFKFNNVFGYFIEVTKANLAHVPADYTRKQTTVNSERFVTPELKEVEHRILGADERARQLEQEEFLRLRETVLEHLVELQDTAGAVATLDVLCGLAETARLYQYCRPLLNASRNLYIRDGRHPVLDQNIGEEKFVPNDTHLEPEQNRLLLITGPNMAGKSTYIRQVALITLMAQIGSFVPAASAEIGLVDRIFTRVGASDDLSRGQSTFMVEMNETALIMNNATECSLVILDEIGRGTATFDGLSIAWSVAEHLHDVLRSRALFATHYHEMTALSRSREGVQNYNIAVREWNERIIFLRKIVPGAADKSYGIQVARLAGLPDSILRRAREILEHLEAGRAGAPQSEAASENEKRTTVKQRPARSREKSADVLPESPSPQLTLFN